MSSTRVRLALGVTVLMFISVSGASAQVFGNYAWQMQPYCNVVSLTLTTTAAGYTLDGVDDQCAGANKASAVGVATFNAGGLVNLNFTIVTAPSGKAVHVAAIVNPANGNGTWTDSVGNSGTFAIGVSTPGLPARPLPTSGVGPATITTVEIAAAAVGASDINTAEVQARVTGTCPAGQAVSAINANGTVTCQATSLGQRFRVEGLATTQAFATREYETLSNWTALPVENVGGGTYSAATGRYTVPAAGTYLVATSVRWGTFTSAAGFRCIFVDAGAGNRGSNCDTPQTGESFPNRNLSMVLTLAAGAGVGITAQQNVQATVNVGTAGVGNSFFSVTRIQ